jgi:exocyst complex component 4
MYSLRIALSPETAPYILEQDVNEPDPQILSLNSGLVSYDETVVRLLRDREVAFVRRGLGLLVNSYLVTNAPLTAPMNARGCGRMQLNILVLQQNLKNVEEDVDLARAANYYSLFEKGPDAVVDKAREQAAAAAAGDDDSASARPAAADRFSYDELKAMLELWYSEQLANPERGISSAARRQLNDKLLGLSEHMWQN